MKSPDKKRMESAVAVMERMKRKADYSSRSKWELRNSRMRNQ